MKTLAACAISFLLTAPALSQPPHTGAPSSETNDKKADAKVSAETAVMEWKFGKEDVYFRALMDVSKTSEHLGAMVNGLLTRDEMASFLREVQYQLDYFDSAAQSGNLSTGNLTSDMREFCRILAKHPYSLSMNIALFDDIGRLHMLTVLYQAKPEISSMHSRLTVLRQKSFEHLRALAFGYEDYFTGDAPQAKPKKKK